MERERFWRMPARVYGRLVGVESLVAVVALDLPQQTLRVALTAEQAKDLTHHLDSWVKMEIDAQWTKGRYHDARLIRTMPYTRRPNVLHSEESARWLREYITDVVDLRERAD